MHGYKPQPDYRIDLVNRNKVAEEGILRTMDRLAKHFQVDNRWLAIARTNIEQGFMALNRAIFQPERYKGPVE